jgi:hypothetical protein
MELIFILAIIIGLIKGFTDNKPSFWRGFGEGLASRDDGRLKTSFYYIDRKTGLGIKIDQNAKR